jgi:predicted transcriptional regulator
MSSSRSRSIDYTSDNLCDITVTQYIRQRLDNVALSKHETYSSIINKALDALEELQRKQQKK